jgi:hypothetical protein
MLRNEKLHENIVKNQARFQNIKIAKELKKDIGMLFVDGDQI